MKSIYAIHRAPLGAPERFALVRWDCVPGAVAQIGDTTYAATVELARVAIPAGLAKREEKPRASRGAKEKPRKVNTKPELYLWLPGPFPGPAVEPKKKEPIQRRKRMTSVIEVWEVPT